MILHYWCYGNASLRKRHNGNGNA